MTEIEIEISTTSQSLLKLKLYLHHIQPKASIMINLVSISLQNSGDLVGEGLIRNRIRRLSIGWHLQVYD